MLQILAVVAVNKTTDISRCEEAETILESGGESFYEGMYAAEYNEPYDKVVAAAERAGPNWRAEKSLLGDAGEPQSHSFYHIDVYYKDQLIQSSYGRCTLS